MVAHTYYIFCYITATLNVQYCSHLTQTYIDAVETYIKMALGPVSVYLPL
jgi:hypothetical protein